jgi:hypothetical protein
MRALEQGKEQYRPQGPVSRSKQAVAGHVDETVPSARRCVKDPGSVSLC